MVAVQSPLLTPAEYLAFERESEIKHEYVAGEIIAMVGASRRHNLIQTATGAGLNLQLRGRRCEVYPGRYAGQRWARSASTLTRTSL